MLSGELDHTNHLQYCLGDTDNVVPHKYEFCQNYYHLQMYNKKYIYNNICLPQIDHVFFSTFN